MVEAKTKKEQGMLSNMYKILKWLALLIGVLLIAFIAIKGNQWMKSWNAENEEISSTVMLERVKEVTKLITVEGYFSEIFDYKDHNIWNFLPFQKKALIRVKAKVSIGTDLTKAKIVADDATKTIHISDIPESEILSIDHDLDYYDLKEGLFNPFETKDYNKMNALAKDFIRKRAEESDLIRMGDNRLKEYLLFLKKMVEPSGWKVIVDGPQPLQQ